MDDRDREAMMSTVKVPRSIEAIATRNAIVNAVMKLSHPTTEAMLVTMVEALTKDRLRLLAAFESVEARPSKLSTLPDRTTALVHRLCEIVRALQIRIEEAGARQDTDFEAANAAAERSLRAVLGDDEYDRMVAELWCEDHERVLPANGCPDCAVVACPMCDGNGGHYDPRGRYARDPQDWIECRLCDGDGKITPAEAATWSEPDYEAIAEARGWRRGR